MTSSIHWHAVDFVASVPPAAGRERATALGPDDARLFETPANLPRAGREDAPEDPRTVHVDPALPPLGDRVPPRQLPSQRSEALDQLKASAAKLETARRAGVDLARASFMAKLLGAAMNAVGVGVAAALTVVTGGAAAPMLAIASMRFLSAAADAGYACKLWRDARDAADGKPVGPPPPMGANALGNLFHAAFSCRPFDAAKAVDRATRAASFVQFGLAVSALAVGAAIVVPAPVVHQVSRIVSSALLIAVFGRETQLMEGQAEARDAVTQASEELATHREALLAWLRSLEGNDRLEALAAIVDHFEDDPVMQALVQDASKPVADEAGAAPASAAGERATTRIRDTARGAVGGYTLWSVINGSLNLAKLLAR